MLNLEKHFSETCEQHPHLKLLESQWSFDKELISKALQNVSSVFPHYSQHDASHSRQLIVNIERMLGDKIKHLTATDSWLLLEAAYNHDIGMVITSEQMKDLDEDEFKSFVQDIALDDKNDLQEFASDWLSGGFKVPFGTLSEDKFFQYKQVIAEWFRKKHPDYSARVVKNPLSIGLSSPRNELLPTRLFGVLANICRAHGQDFEKVMDLPFSETGMATEDCHPRYVASLLRMADLLDIDDNRFCPVMVNMCHGGLPKISHLHHEKHNSIKHFRLDSERIEVRAEPTVEAYEVTFEWFQWLCNEHHKQTQRWDEIVPNKLLGQLPTLRIPEVGVQAPFFVLDEGKKPSFTFDDDAVIDLVQGAGLYSEKFEAIREIIQNAIDATLAAIWIDNSRKIPTLNPVSRKLAKLFNKNKINISLFEKSQASWTLNIIDQGIGISTETLKYMLNIGSSSKNPEKRDIIKEMPLWFRPSGNFGIGFQSIFLISENIIFTTKSRLTNEAIKVIIQRNGKEKITIEKLDDKSIPYGTNFEIEITPEKHVNIGRHYSYEDKNFLSTFNSYDITNEKSDLSEVEIYYLSKSIENFSIHSPIPILFQNKPIIDKDRNARFFCQENNISIIYISFFHTEKRRKELQNESFLFFRGQHVRHYHIDLDWCVVSVDIYGYSASEILFYNRDAVKPEKHNELQTKIRRAIYNYLRFNFDKLEKRQKKYAAAYLFQYNDEQKHIKLFEDLSAPAYVFKKNKKI